MTYIYIAIWKVVWVLSLLTFHGINWDIPMLECEGVTRWDGSHLQPQSSNCLSRYSSLIYKFSLWAEINSDCLRIHKQASCKQIDIATTVFQYETIRPQKCIACIIKSLRYQVALDARDTFYLRKQTHRLWDWTRRLCKNGPDSQSSGQPISAG